MSLTTYIKVVKWLDYLRLLPDESGLPSGWNVVWHSNTDQYLITSSLPYDVAKCILGKIERYYPDV